MAGVAKRLVLEVVGWILLVVGIAALFLPGPGLLAMFAGLALLSQRYVWAGNRVEPVKLQALKAAAEGVETWPRIMGSLLGVVVLVVAGLVWIQRPDAPGWWPLSDAWWLPGGLWTGVTQIASAGIALGLIVYSYRRFHGHPEAVAEVRDAIRRRAERSDS